MSNKEEYLREIRKYYSHEYVKILNFNSIEDDKIRTYLSSFDLNLWSHKNRIVRNMQIIKHLYVINKTNVITVCFKVTLDNTSCIYAYMHFQCTTSSFEPMYICASPTFYSQDGEYRYRYMRWNQFEQLYDKYLEDFEPIEAAALEKISRGRMSFQTDFYYPSQYNVNQQKLKDFIDTRRLQIKFYTLCWIVDYYRIHNKIIENHVNPAYIYVIYQEEDEHILTSLLRKYRIDGLVFIISRIIGFKYNINEPDYNIDEPECGQKIFPLTAIEAVKTDDINFNVWREIYITNLMSNLVLNLIAPSFPFVNNWFYIQNTNTRLFDNISIHDKYVQSEIASFISSNLKNIDKYNYINKHVNEGPISNKFFHLSKDIHKAIIFADSNINLTDLSVCLVSEYVGRTLRDLPTLITCKDHMTGLDDVFIDIDIFTKHIFEFIYAFHCMNTKMGIIHGDLHMNNVTIYKLYSMMATSDGIPYVKYPHIAYILGQDVYVFHHIGLFSMIIDFSRSIIGDYKRLENEFSPRFAELYFKEQRSRVMHMIYHYFPELTKKFHNAIEALLVSNFPLMFKILTAIDTYVITSNILAMFSLDDAFTHGRIKIAKGAANLLQKIIEQSEHLIVTNIKTAIEGRINNVDDIEWPNITIIRKQFSKFMLTHARMQDKNINIVEVFNHNNDVTYDVEDYDTWGPLLSLDKEIEFKKKFKQPMTKGVKQWLKYKHSDESDIINKLTSKYEEQVKDVLEFESWMLI